MLHDSTYKSKNKFTYVFQLLCYYLNGDWALMLSMINFEYLCLNLLILFYVVDFRAWENCISSDRIETMNSLLQFHTTNMTSRT